MDELDGLVGGELRRLPGKPRTGHEDALARALVGHDAVKVPHNGHPDGRVVPLAPDDVPSAENRLGVVRDDVDAAVREDLAALRDETHLLEERLD